MNMDKTNKRESVIVIDELNKTENASSCGGEDARPAGDITIYVDIGYVIDTKGVYNVYSADGLHNVAELVYDDGETDIDITLLVDIDMSDAVIGGCRGLPIGYGYHPYNGTFDGNGKTITGLTVSDFDPEGIGRSIPVGLFGCIGKNGTVRNLRLANVSAKGERFIGGIAGINRGTITGCSVEGGTVTVVEESSYSGNAGGIAGINNGTITSCHASVRIDGNHLLGGVAGSNNGTITACYATGDVSVEYGGAVGGVAGDNCGTVTACYWDNELSNGIGEDQTGTGQATKVEDDVTWTDAMEAMNEALANAGNEWRYAAGSGDSPLVLTRQGE